MLERLFRAYFSDGLLVSDRETLVVLAQEVGVEGVDALLDGDALADAVRLDEQRAHQLGINGVPALIFNSDVLVSGAQGADAMLEALNEARSNRSGARA
jgi:predicted DsbA family dithiol-disulfide isomerase